MQLSNVLYLELLLNRLNISALVDEGARFVVRCKNLMSSQRFHRVYWPQDELMTSRPEGYDVNQFPFSKNKTLQNNDVFNVYV